jgi:uncharacterized membrane protein
MNTINSKISEIVDVIMHMENENNDVLFDIEKNELKNDLRIIEKDELINVIYLKSFKYFLPIDFFNETEEGYMIYSITNESDLVEEIYDYFLN